MSSAIRSIRFLPGGESLDRQRYKDGEIFYDRLSKTIRVFDGNTVGGFKLATQDFVTDNASSSFVSATAPTTANPGNIWFNTDQGKIYVYYNNLWVEPAGSGGVASGITIEEARDAVAAMFLNGAHTGISFNHDDSSDQIGAVVSISYNNLLDKPTLFSGSYNDLTNKPNLFSGSYNDLTNKPNLFSGSYNDLTDKPGAYTLPTASTTVLGGVKVDGTTVTINGNGVISAVSSGGTPGGSNTQVQYNNNGAFAGSSNLTFDGSNLTVGGTVTATVLTSSGTGTPTYTSASDFIFNTGSNIGAVVINGDLEMTGQISVGATTGTPTNASSPTSWLKVTVGTSIYYMPLYQ